jgi:alpha-D-ribose 1-methylphosphonate 5-triphosphate synthase subunit PhnL
VVAEPALAAIGTQAAHARAAALLEHLGVPRRLWSLPPATFSGGEKQRINLARGFCAGAPLLLLDEPTASLDPVSRERVVELIRRTRDDGTAIIAVFHDADLVERLADHTVTLDAVPC